MTAFSQASRDVVAGLIVAGVAWFCYDRFSEASALYDRQVAALDEASLLAAQIELLRQKPDRAAMNSRSDRSLAEAIEKAAGAAGLAREQIARIEPQTPRQSGDYLEHPTVVQLDAATLEKLRATLGALRSSEESLADIRVSSLRLAAPYQEGAASDVEAWNIELTLTYLVYSPKTPSAQK